MGHSPAASTTEMLTTIWRRVFQKSTIGPEENFFDLGGDPLLAAELVSQVSQACGRDVSPMMIYYAPSISALTIVLEQPELPRLPQLLSLKSGSESAPIYIAAGLGASLMDFFYLLKEIQTQHPIYGLQARGHDGGAEPFESVERTAQYYLEAIKEAQPTGPYYLIGYSFGGLVMLELAQRLSGEGERVALLAMLDSYPHFNNLSLSQRARLATKLIRHHLSTAKKLPIREAVSYVIRGSKRKILDSTDRGDPKAYSQAKSESMSVRMQRTRDSEMRALKQYRPSFYNGMIKFIRAEKPTIFPDDAYSIWSGLARKVEVVTVPGDHQGILTTHFDDLASVLSGFLREAFGSVQR